MLGTIRTWFGVTAIASFVWFASFEVAAQERAKMSSWIICAGGILRDGIPL